MKVWDVATKKQLFVQNDRRKSYKEKLIKHYVNDILFAPNQKVFATGSGRSTGKGDIVLWNTKTFKILKHFDLAKSEGYARALAFGKNGKTLYNTGSLGMVQGRNIKTGKLVTNFESKGSGHPCPCGFSPDLKYVFSACGSTWVVQSLATGKVVYSRKRGDLNHTSIAFNAKNSSFAVAGQDASEKYSIDLFYDQTGRLIRSLQGYPGQITSVKFSHNNFRIASGNYQRPTRI